MHILEHGIVVDTARLRPAGLRVLATDELPIYSRFTLTIVDTSGVSVNARLGSVLRPRVQHRVVDFLEEQDMRFMVRAAAYHLERIILIYAEHTQHAERHASTHERRPVSVAQDEPRLYYELHSFLVSAVIAYDMLRTVLWKHFGGKGGRPRSLATLLHAPLDWPSEEYKERVRASWEETGARLKAYRDTIVHYTGLDPGHTNLRNVPMHGGRWGLDLRLPSNPTARSRAQYDHEGGPEALAYCHDVLCELTDLSMSTEESLAAVVDFGPWITDMREHTLPPGDGGTYGP